MIRRNEWAENVLPKLDKRLFVVFDKELQLWEVWMKRYDYLPTPKDAMQAEDWQFEFCNGDFVRLMKCIMPDGTIADPGPWLAEVLESWDTRKNGKENLRRWLEAGQEAKKKKLEREKNDQCEQIKYYRKAIERGLEDKFGGGDVLVEPEPMPRKRLRLSRSG